MLLSGARGVFSSLERTESVTIASIIVEIKDGVEDRVLPELGMVPAISVFGSKGNQIVTVVEGETSLAVNDVIHTLSLIEGVTGVFPVYAGEPDE